jgi:outer membrane immunogenic protein
VALAPASWSGFYVGVHGGYGWGDNDFAEVISVIPLQTIGGIESEGAVFGGHAGYNWQSGSVVGGLEIDISGSDIDGSSDPLVRNFAGGITITDTEADDVKYLGTMRARLGYSGFSNYLLYATGGIAWERIDRVDSTVLVVPGTTQTAVTRAPNNVFGWVIGAGGEMLLGGNWVGRIEYLHYDFGEIEPTTTVVTVPATPGGTFADDAGSQTIEVVRAAISYKFN